MRILATVTFLFLFLTANAGNGVWESRIDLEDVISGYDYLISDPTISQQTPSSLEYESYRGFVFLDYTRKNQSDLTQQYPWKIDVRVQYMDGGALVEEVLNISSNVDNIQTSEYYQYSDYFELASLSGVSSFEVQIIEVTGSYYNGGWVDVSNPQNNPNFPDDIDIRLELRSERWYELVKGDIDPELVEFKFDPLNYRLSWSYLEGAEEYDIEWVFIDELSQESNEISSIYANAYGYEVPFHKKEPARVRLWQTHYVLDKLFPEGTIYFRIRAISKYPDFQSGMTNATKSGEWTYFELPSSYLGSGQYNQGTTVFHTINAAEVNEPNKSWSYSIAYAENGKSVSRVSYLDGSNRVRQSLTYNTSDDITIVGETKYDREGRQNLSILPALLNGKDLSYHQDLNLAVGSNNIFDEDDYDYQDFSIPPTELLTNNSSELGAAQYFSPENTFTNDLFRKAIPDAEGFVYSQTVYRNDGSGRVERSGGLGKAFQISGDRAIRTFYGTPTLAELKRLFGSNVPDKLDSYRKEVVRDANGQYSVSYYDKRGYLIANGIAGNAPENLIPIANQEEIEGIVTPLNDNNVQVGNNSLVSEHTFIPSYENMEIKLNYSVNEVLQAINGQTVSVGGSSFTFEEICVECEYILNIEVVDQNGVHYFPSGYSDDYSANIESQGDCANPPVPANQFSTGTLIYNLNEVKEYRIIKTLTVDVSSMISDYYSDLNLASWNDMVDFIDLSTLNIDYSDCYTNCDEYCEALQKYTYDEANGVGAWNALSQTARDQMISSCKEDYCDPNEIYEDFQDETGSEINPFEGSCDAALQQMIDQITPGGVFYEDLNSWLWNESANYSLPDPVNISGISRSHAFLQVPSNMTDAVAEELILSGYHREICHYNWCDEEADIALYGLEISTYINSLSGTFASHESLLEGIYNEPSLSYLSEPFLSHPGNINNELQNAINDYLGHINYNDDIYNINQSLCSNPPSGQNSLFDYVEGLIACLQATAPVGTSIDYDELAYSTFSSLYKALVTELIGNYKDAVNCDYYSDVDAIFTIAELDNINDIVSNVLSQVYDETCESTALLSTENFIDGISPACSTALVTNGLLVPGNIDGTLLDLNSEAGNNPPPSPDNRTLEQLYYDFMVETCPENTFGWFFNPVGIESDAIDEYDGINDLLTNTSVVNECGASIVQNIEVLPPTLVGTGVTVQNIPDCVDEYLSMVNNGLNGLNNILGGSTSSIPLCTAGYGSGYGYTEVVNSTTYPILADVNGCNIAGEFKFWVCENAQGEFHMQIGIDNGSCLLKLDAIPIDDQGNFPNTDSYVVSISNPVKYSTFYLPNNPTPLQNVIIVDGLYANGGSGQFYFEPNNCLDFGDFSEQYIYTWEYEIGDEQQVVDDCISQTSASVEIEAQILYNQYLNEMEEQLSMSFQSCLDGTIEDFQLEYNLKEYHYTLYYYDLASNLVQTVPPQGVNPASISFDQNGLWNGGEPDHSMETRYKYDGLNTMLAQYSPDGGRTDYILDEFHRVRFSQNASQSSQKSASYMKYDELGRVIEAGEFFDALNLYDNPSTTSVDEALQFLESKIGDNNYPDVLTETVLDYTQTYYEEIYLPDPSISQNEFIHGEQENLRNAIGAIYHRELVFDYNTGNQVNGSVSESVISYSYDAHKNVREVVTTNYLLEDIGQAHKSLEYEYDLISKNISQMVYQKGDEDEYRHQYHFDANNRLVRVYTSSDKGINWDRDAKYYYYLHGPMARKEIGMDHIQGIDFAYNLQGWLKGVNSNTLISNWDIGLDGNNSDNKYFGVDAFGYSLGYFGDGDGNSQLPDSDYSPIESTMQAFALTAEATTNNIGYNASLFSGNVSNMVTAMRNVEEERIQPLLNNYKYDQLQRIRTMDVYHNEDLDSDNDFLGAELYQGGAFKTNYRYDANGNLLLLQRNGHDGNLLDKLKYGYYQEGQNEQTSNYTTDLQTTTNSNRLSYVSDEINFVFGSPDEVEDISPGQLANNYEYNEIGQLIADNQEDIEEIIWTATGKVKEIRYSEPSGKKDVRFIYNPLDMRIAKQVFTSCNYISTTYYSYDPQGNVMATYSHIQHPPTDGESWEVQGSFVEFFTLEENMICSGSRIGVDQRALLLYQGDFDIPSTPMPTFDICENTEFLVRGYQESFFYDQSQRIVGNKKYEFSNHLGNVLVVTTDRKVEYFDGGNTTYSADVISYSDYYPFGMKLQGERLLANAISEGTSDVLVFEDIIYEQRVNSSVDYLNTLKIEDFTTGTWSSGASSQQSIEVGEAIKFTVTSLQNNTVVGLTFLNSNTGLNDAEAGLFLYGGQVDISTSSITIQTNEPISVGDILSIHRDGSNILFKRNGVQFYSIVDPDITLPMLADIAFNSDGTLYSVGELQIGKLQTFSLYDSQYYTRSSDNEGSYRYGFNGMEYDDELKGRGNSYKTEFRLYDPRLGRWLSIDPLAGMTPWDSPYCAFANNPIYFVDPSGLTPIGPPDQKTVDGKKVDWQVGDTYVEHGLTYRKEEDGWSIDEFSGLYFEDVKKILFEAKSAWNSKESGVTFSYSYSIDPKAYKRLTSTGFGPSANYGMKVTVTTDGTVKLYAVVGGGMSAAFIEAAGANAKLGIMLENGELYIFAQTSYSFVGWNFTQTSLNGEPAENDLNWNITASAFGGSISLSYDPAHMEKPYDPEDASGYGIANGHVQRGLQAVKDANTPNEIHRKTVIKVLNYQNITLTKDGVETKYCVSELSPFYDKSKPADWTKAWDLSSMYTIVTGGSPADVKKRERERKARIKNWYWDRSFPYELK